MGVMSLDTYDVNIKEIGNPETLGHGFYTMGFCINSAGEYLYVDAQSQTLGKSTDKGVTWTETDISEYSGWPESITQLSNGRYLFWPENKRSVYYSDDDCVTWTEATISNAKYEGSFLELPGGVVMCFMRKSTNGTDNGAWNGTKIKEPIVLSISNDYGTTWSAATDSTTLLEGCANIATAFYHDDEDLVEVFTSPRYPYGDAYGAVFQYIATREDALNDRFGTPKVVLYSNAHAYQDFGHIGGCLDANGDMHLMYYDGDGDASGSVNYHYLKASRNQAVLPVTKNDKKSLFLPYSSNIVEGLLVNKANADEIPTKLPNPFPLKINGEVYDGSSEVDIGNTSDVGCTETVLMDYTTEEETSLVAMPMLDTEKAEKFRTADIIRASVTFTAAPTEQAALGKLKFGLYRYSWWPLAFFNNVANAVPSSDKTSFKTSAYRFYSFAKDTGVGKAESSYYNYSNSGYTHASVNVQLDMRTTTISGGSVNFRAETDTVFPIGTRFKVSVVNYREN